MCFDILADLTREGEQRDNGEEESVIKSLLCEGSSESWITGSEGSFEGALGKCPSHS